MIAHNSKDNGLTGIGNSHKPDSFISLEFASGSILSLPFARLGEMVNVGVWYTGLTHIRVIEINGERGLRGRALGYIANRGYMVICYNANSSMTVNYTVSHCPCALCNGTSLSLVKQMENDARWAK